MTLAVNIAQSGSNNVTMRNRIINGGMTISQRNGTTGTLITADNQYGLDRWTCRTSLTSKLTNTQSTTAPAGFSYSNQITVTTSATPSSGDYVSLKQSIEGYNVADLNWGSSNAKAVNLSFWVYSSVTGTYGGRLLNSDVSQCWVFQYTISSANTWTFVTVPVTGPTSGTWNTTNGIGIAIQFDLGSGSAFATSTTNSWISSDAIRVSGNVQLIANSGANWYVTGVQLEAGTTASPFEYRQYGTETYLCKRYYQKSPTEGRPVGSMNGSTTGLFGFVWEVEMRAAPTIQYYGGNTAGGTFKTYTNGNATNVTSDNGIALSAKGARTNFAAASGNGGGGTWIDYGTGTDQMGWAVSAEL